MPSYMSIKSGASFQGRDAELAEMVEEIKDIQVGDRSVAVASYWYNREWLVKHFFPEESRGLDGEGLRSLGDERGLPSRCPASLWALSQVEKERQDLFVNSGLSFTRKMVRQVNDLAGLDADSQPGSYKVPYLNGPTGSGKTMLVRVYSASLGKAYFPILCTNDNDEMLTKKLTGQVSLRVGVRTDEMKKRANYGVFETKDALLSFLRELKQAGGGDTLESHLNAMRNIGTEEWDGIAASNGFPSDQSFAGTFVLGEAALAARIPGGVVVNFDELGLVSETLQASVRDGFSDRSEVHRYGVNHIFTTTDNPPGAKYLNRTQLSGDTASRLQFITVDLPGPEEMVPDVCKGLGHRIDAEESRKRMMGDPKCATTPGLEEPRQPILDDREGMDADILPPSNVIRKMAAVEAELDPVKFFKTLIGDQGGKYFPDKMTEGEQFMPALLSREQAVNLSMRIVSLFSRAYQQLNEPTGALNPRFYSHESTNSPELSRRTLRSICSSIEDQMRGAIDRSKEGERVNMPECLSMSVMKSLETYVFKQVDFRAAPTGTTLEGESSRKAVRESRPVISQIVRDSGLGWGDLMELFAPAQVGWVEGEVVRMFGVEDKKDLAKISGAAGEIAREMNPQDSILKVSVGDEIIFIPVGVEGGGGGDIPKIDGMLLYRTLDPHNDGITLDQLRARIEAHETSPGVDGEPLLDFIAQAAKEEGIGSGAENLAARLDSGKAEIGCKWGGDMSKSNSGVGAYLIALGGGKALALDYGVDPVRKAPEVQWKLLNGRDEMASFVCSTVLDRDAPGFCVPGEKVRKHTTLTLIRPTGAVMRVAKGKAGLEVGQDIPEANFGDARAAAPGVKAAVAPLAKVSGPAPSLGGAKTRKKQTYTRKSANIDD